MARVIVADDCSGAEHVAALRAIDGIDLLVAGERNAGFAANVNRGLRASDGERDVVVLNSDVEALPSWLECLQYATDRHPYAGIVGAQLQYPDGRIQFGGTVRNRDAPEWFDHRYRFKPSDWPGRAREPGARRNRRVHVRPPRGDRARRPARRALPDGLRGRRLVPARVAGRLRRALFPRRAARAPRVGHARHRPGRARAGVTAAVLGALVGALRRAHGRRIRAGGRLHAR